MTRERAIKLLGQAQGLYDQLSWIRERASDIFFTYSSAGFYSDAKRAFELWCRLDRLCELAQERIDQRYITAQSLNR